MNFKKWRVKRKQIMRMAFMMAFVLGILQLKPAMASTIDNATEKKEEAQSGLDAAKGDISRIEGEQARLRQEIDALDSDLVTVIMNLGILKNDIVAKEEELVQVQADLVQAQEDEAEQYEAMKKRIQFMYERGNNAFLTSILESESITDLLNRVEYVNEMYDYDRNLLAAYQATKLRVADLELQVESEIAEMEELQANLEEEEQRYETLIAQKQGQIADFDVQLADAKELADRYQATIDEQNEIIRQEEERRRQAEEERQRQAEEERRRQEAEANSSSSSGSSSNNGSSGSSSNNGSSGSSSDNGSSGSSSDNGSSGDAGLNPGYATGVSGTDVVNYACTFIGNPYVWGGTDPNTGADCSGFIKYVYAHFGITLPRWSGDQHKAGKEVSYSNAQPGDIICYSGHVAIYMGNGQIVHASSSAPYPAGGIKTGNATYRTIISVRRVL